MDPGQKPGDTLGTAPLLNEGKASHSAPVSMSQEQEPRLANYRTAEGKYRSYLLRTLSGPLKFVIIFGVIGALLAIPVIVIDADAIIAKAEIGDIDAFFAQQTRQVLYYIFGWLLISWVGLAISFAIGTVLPYLFRFIARYLVHSLVSTKDKPADAVSYQICKPGTYAILAGAAHLAAAHQHRRSSQHFVHWFCSCVLSPPLLLPMALAEKSIVDLVEPRQPRHLIRQSRLRPRLD